MGPLFFLVLLVPFTLNGFAVREAFFVSFLGSVGIDADAAFAAGFLFFLVTVALAAPGGGDSRLGVDPRRRPSRGRAWLTRRRVVVTYNALPWIEQCLAGLSGTETVVVDNGSTDGTLAFVRERFPDVRLLERANRGLGAGWATGIAETSASLGADAQRRRVARGGCPRAAGRRRRGTPRRGGRRPEAAQPGRVAAALGARLPDAVAARDRVSLSPQARPRTRALNAFYGAGFDHASASERWNA